MLSDVSTRSAPALPNSWMKVCLEASNAGCGEVSTYIWVWPPEKIIFIHSHVFLQVLKDFCHICQRSMQPSNMLAASDTFDRKSQGNGSAYPMVNQITNW